jgi:hypothetical protein
MPEFGWTRNDDAGDLPAWELTADPRYYVERWAPGSYAAWHGDIRLGEPGSYGSRSEAQDAAEAAYRRDHTGRKTRHA